MPTKDRVEKEKVWRWCPVCMSSQIFEWREGQLACTNFRHHELLRSRKDSWVKELPEWQALQQRM